MGVQAKPLSGNKWILLAVLLGLVGYNKFKKSGSQNALENKSNAFIISQLTDNQISYTDHAICRMACREITHKEVEYILKNGQVNWDKSDKNDQPCPSYALEGKTKDGQFVRIVFADCASSTRVITAIDLNNEYKCSCR